MTAPIKKIRQKWCSGLWPGETGDFHSHLEANCQVIKVTLSDHCTIRSPHHMERSWRIKFYVEREKRKGRAREREKWKRARE